MTEKQLWEILLFDFWALQSKKCTSNFKTFAAKKGAIKNSSRVYDALQSQTAICGVQKYFVKPREEVKFVFEVVIHIYMAHRKVNSTEQLKNEEIFS